jgi:endonuclease YncB( thermonuclease family)
MTTGTVGRVIDGRTFALEDGRVARLTGVEVPLPAPERAGTPDRGSTPGGQAAKAALEALVGGDEVVLRQAESGPDRYGRMVAYAYAVRDGAELFVQAELVASGFARVAEQAGSRACALELLQRETAARKAKLGLWADPYYDVLGADAPEDVLARRGRFALVEGPVVSVHESGTTIYLNFGRQWTRDFAVTISKRNERSFAAAGLDLKALAGHRVRVRGWIEERGGTERNPERSPLLEAASPEQIEIVDHGQ